MENNIQPNLTSPDGHRVAKKSIFKKWWFWAILVILVLVIACLLIWKYLLKDNSIAGKKAIDQTSNSQTADSKNMWNEGGVAIEGKYADAEIAESANGQYRMYYSIEPEVPGNKFEVYSATSTDGINWTKENGIRRTFSTFPDVLKLNDGSWRMYSQNAGVIKSAISSDGLTWTDESGIRIDKIESGFNIDNVGAQSTIILPDGTYLMVYRGTVPEPYKISEKLPNNNTQIYFYATSTDGLTFEKKGLAIDSRNEILYGLADGAEWVKWDNDELRIYFWSYAGIFYSTYKNGSFSDPIFDFTNAKDDKHKFPSNPPGDPTLAKINNQWFMYYGQHTKGIYYAILQ